MDAVEFGPASGPIACEPRQSVNRTSTIAATAATAIEMPSIAFEPLLSGAACAMGVRFANASALSACSIATSPGVFVCAGSGFLTFTVGATVAASGSALSGMREV